MGSGSDFELETNTYEPGQVEATLRQVGVEIDNEGPTYFVAFCPFHGNRVTPSFTVHRLRGSFWCFNPSCGVKGGLIELVKKQTGKSEFAARRTIILNKGSDGNFADQMRKAFSPVKFPDFSQDKIDQMVGEFWSDGAPIAYMQSRGFGNDTLRYFQIGYSKTKKLVSVPMHDIHGNPVGVIGRSILDKRFKNSNRLPSPRTLWNIHRAKKFDEVIIVEASFDAMRVHQAGYPNVVGCLMGYFSPEHVAQISQNFNVVTIMTDFDDKAKHIYIDCHRCRTLCVGHNPGRDLGMSIARNLGDKEVRWAMYDDSQVFPHGAKDPGEMTDKEISVCVDNAIPHVRYTQTMV